MQFDKQITKIQKFDPSSFYSEMHNVVYLAIPKNANMLIRNVLVRNEFGVRKFQQDLRLEYPNKVKPGVTRVFSIVRDPYTRLISGMGEYLKRRERIRVMKTDLIVSKLNEFLESPDKFDEHLEPQSVFIWQGWPTAWIDFDNMMPQLKTLFLRWGLENQYNLIEGNYKSDRHHGYKKNYGKAGVPKYILANHRDLLDACVQKYYASDLELYNAVRNSSK